MYKEHWEELEAQVEDHGPERVVFQLSNDGRYKHPGVYDVVVEDVTFEDDKIVVRLA